MPVLSCISGRLYAKGSDTMDGGEAAVQNGGRGPYEIWRDKNAAMVRAAAKSAEEASMDL